MRLVAAAILFGAAAPASAAELGALALGIDTRVEGAPLGGVAADLGFGIEGLLTRTRPVCAGLRIGLDPGSGGEGTSTVGTLGLPILARGGWCGGTRALFFAWGGVGASITFVTTEVAGTSRTDTVLQSLFGVGVDVLPRIGPFAALVGLSAELESDRFAGVLRLGFGAFGP